jgi:hypothetical protein
MSIKVMSWVWENGPEQQSARFVLLALADFANDAGECWPSIDGIARKVCMSDRGVQKVLRQLEADGWIATEIGGGRRGANVYRIALVRPTETPNDVPPERCSPRTTAQKTLNDVHHPPNMSSENPERRSPEPSRTIKEPPRGSVREGARARASPIPPDWEPSPEDFADAIERGFSEHEAENEARKFRDYHRSVGRPRADWSAAFRKWLADAPQFGHHGGMAGGAQAGRGGRGGSIASIAARRRAAGVV